MNQIQTAITSQRMSVASSDEEDEGEQSLIMSGLARNEYFPLSEIKIGTWSVNDMNDITSNFNILKEVTETMKDNGLQILGLCETKWIGNKVEVLNEVVVCSSGGRMVDGVAILLAKELEIVELKVNFISPRILMVEIETKSCNFVIFQVYLPMVCDDSEINDFYDTLEIQIDKVQEDNYLVLMGDFNAMVGKRQEGDEKVIGEFGHEHRNDRGKKLVHFCRRKGLIITNTLFNQNENQRHTYFSPNMGMVQLDYIMVRKRWRMTVLDSRTYPNITLIKDNKHIHILVAMSISVDSKENGRIRAAVQFFIDKFHKYTYSILSYLRRVWNR